MDSRRRSDSGANHPAVQVVGFHVEGQSPSPGPSSILQESMRKITSGSPTPVIIPPHFQAARPEGGTSRNLVTDFAGRQGQPGIDIPKRKSTDRTPAEVAEDQAIAAARAAAANNTAAAATTSDSSTAAGAAAKGAGAPAAAGAGAAKEGAPSSSSTSTAAAATADGAEPAAGAAGAASTAATSGSQDPAPAQKQKPGRNKPDNRPENIVPKPKPATKAERRAQQEASRAAKAAAKAAADGGRPPSAGAASDGGASTSSRSSRAAAGAADAPSSGGRPPAGGAKAAGGGAVSFAGSEAGDSSRPAHAGGSGEAGAGKAGSRSSSERRGRTTGGMLNFTELFAHLPQYRAVSVESMLLQQQQQRDAANVHPSVFALGLQYADGSIKGSTARCVAMVHALAQMVSDYTTPEGKSLARDLMSCLNGAVDYLVRCRPLSVSMGNAIKHIKLGISKTDPSEPEASAKEEILRLMSEYLHEKVTVADQVLVPLAVQKVSDGDVILTYAYSQVVLRVLLEAKAAGRRFRVVVVDGRPELEGRQMLRRLLQAQVPCSYLYLSGLSYIMGEVTKVILGAAAVLSNGTVVSRAGCAAVAMTAAASSTPVLVCCETFKFHERVQLDSITHNELGDPEELVRLPPHVRQQTAAAAAAAAAAGGGAPGSAAGKGLGPASSALAGWQNQPRLGLLNLKYDAMPAEYVTVVVTEFGMIPPSSVPVILREYSESARQEQ